jgi:integrase
MVQLQRCTGMRPGEVVCMTMGQIDRSTDPWIYRPTKHKGASQGRIRAIPLGPRAQELLAPWLRADRDAALFNPRESRERLDASRPNLGQSTEEQRAEWRQRRRKERRRKGHIRREHEMYSTRTYGNSVANGCIRAGIPPFRCHRIRHTYATKVRHQFGLEAAQVLLGHTKADVTELYAEKNLTLAVEIARKIG